MNEDPRDLRGYGFVLIYYAVTGMEISFYTAVEEGKKKGVPELQIDYLAAGILLKAGQFVNAYDVLCAYERKWYKVYDKSR